MIGVPDVEWSEIVKAVIVCTEGGDRPSDEDLTGYVKSRIASYKAPGALRVGG